MKHWRLGFLAIFLFCAGSIAFALYHQFYHWLMPCLMCVYERLSMIGIGLLALLVFIFPAKGRWGILLRSGTVSLMALLGAGVATRHLIMQYGPPDPIASCASSLPFPINLNDPFWPEWFTAIIRPVGDCSVIDFKMFGLSMPIWVLLSCLGIALFSVLLAYCQWQQINKKRWWK